MNQFQNEKYRVIHISLWNVICMQFTPFDGYTDTLSKQNQNATRIFTDFLKC